MENLITVNPFDAGFVSIWHPFWHCRHRYIFHEHIIRTNGKISFRSLCRYVFAFGVESVYDRTTDDGQYRVDKLYTILVHKRNTNWMRRSKYDGLRFEILYFLVHQYKVCLLSLFTGYTKCLYILLTSTGRFFYAFSSIKCMMVLGECMYNKYNEVRSYIYIYVLDIYAHPSSMIALYIAICIHVEWRKTPSESHFFPPFNINFEIRKK